ncbi:G2/mitotic-specific cyclin [Batrachochytrium dendrobatidis]|nr:G2/mitotic-specific cyclin [Batrachochytrium dendrobatidis]KAK5667102.1 G2/mitotic-specific cyclin [Batrachochytrium dendrobatidis]
MFAAAAQSKTKVRITRQSAATAVAGKFNDENARAVRSTRGTTAKEALKSKDSCSTTTVVTRKRAVLKEKAAVSNTIKTLAAGEKATATLKTRTTTTQIRTRKASEALGEVTSVQTTTTRTRSAAAIAAAPVSKLAKKTQQAIEAVVPVAIPKETAPVVKKGTKEAVSKDSAIVPSAAETFKAHAAIKKESHTIEHKLDHDDFQPKEHISKKARTVDWDDLDEIDGDDPTMLSEYVQEIFEYMHTLENQTMANPNYMEQQNELQWKMRSILVDWLIEVHNKFRLLAETLFLAVNIVDRFLSLRVVSLVKLQLVGVTAMFIAAKYEEVVSPSIQSFLYMADGGYTDDEILRAERYVLQVLDFALQYPTPMSFLRRCSKADGYDIQTRTLAKYLMEVSLVDHRFISIPPSQIAASGLYLARRMLDRSPWNPNLIHYSSYKEEELQECSELVLDYLSKPVKYEALYKKYSARKFLKVAIFVEDWIAKQKDKNLFCQPSDRSDVERSSGMTAPQSCSSAVPTAISNVSVKSHSTTQQESENNDPCENAPKQTVRCKAQKEKDTKVCPTQGLEGREESVYDEKQQEDSDADDGRPSSQSSETDA